MNPKKTVIPIILALFLSLIAGVVGLASANPILMPLVVVDSPQNNQIYATTQVQLKFALSPYAYYNFSSFAYSLDGQPTKATDGNTVLTNLAAGSHTLTIYGNGTYQSDYNAYTTHNDLVLAIVYFSVVYSTAWVTFGLILFAAFSVTSLVLFTNRRQLASRFKAKKTLSFWFGLTCFLFASLFFIANGWGMASNYLFPYYPHRLEVILFSPVLFFIGGMVFMVLGVGMMVLGTKERRDS
jgi:hypothetical protein